MWLQQHKKMKMSLKSCGVARDLCNCAWYRKSVGSRLRIWYHEVVAKTPHNFSRRSVDVKKYRKSCFHVPGKEHIKCVKWMYTSGARILEIPTKIFLKLSYRKLIQSFIVVGRSVCRAFDLGLCDTRYRHNQLTTIPYLVAVAIVCLFHTLMYSFYTSQPLRKYCWDNSLLIGTGYFQ